MKPAILPVAGLAALVLAAGGAVHQARAHHGGVEFDLAAAIDIKGKVTLIEWTNPHTRIHLTVSEAGQKPQAWVVDAGTPNSLTRNGLTRQSIGVEIAVRGHPSRDRRCDPACTGYAKEITLPDGRKVFLGASAPAAPAAQR